MKFVLIIILLSVMTFIFLLHVWHIKSLIY
jgi:hypothetical protein